MVHHNQIAPRTAHRARRFPSAALFLAVLFGAMIGCARSDASGVYKSHLSVEGRLPKLDATEWIGTPALTPESLRGKVVLVDFWTYSCINCIRVTPYLNAWADKYRDQGLVVLGVHTPEFGFEKHRENIQEEMRRFHIAYPVAVDSEYKIWNAFGNQYWPAYYLVDAKGRIRYHQFGEGDYDKAETAIQELLAEANNSAADHNFVRPAATGAQAPPDARGSGSPETYLGYRQAVGFASPERVRRDRSATYSAPTLKRNTWALNGTWIVSAENAHLDHAGGSISYRFLARDLHLVMAASNAEHPVRFQITIDGHAPGSDHGADTDANGVGTVSNARLYQLVRQSGAPGEHTLEIRFEDAGVDAFVFTFG